MESTNNRYNLNARASPGSDVPQINVHSANFKKSKKKKNVRAYPPSDVKDKSRNSQTIGNKLRLATWNVGTLTGRTSELSDTLRRRDINICCLQETRWKGSKAKNIGHDYKLFYHGTTNQRNGVAIVVDRHFKQRVVKVDRRTDRIMSIKLALDGQPPLNIIAAYAPQDGCQEGEHEQFWDELESLMQEIPIQEQTILGGDLNGHVGTVSTDYPEQHGGFGFGSSNCRGLTILRFASSNNLAVVNTFFQKKPEHLITYKSGNHATQIDYFLTKRDNIKYFRDCKVIPGEALTSQHRILVSCYTLQKSQRIEQDRTPKIKWCKLNTSKGIELIDAMADYLREDMNNLNKSVNDRWNDFENNCKSTASTALGVAKGGYKDKENADWWDDNIKDIIAQKKVLFKTWQSTQLTADKELYYKAKKAAKQAVAQAKAVANQHIYDNLENADRDYEIYKIAKRRLVSTQDFKNNKYIKDEKDNLLLTNAEINQRWFSYFNTLLNEEFPSRDFISLPSTAGPINVVTPAEVKSAIQKMKNNKSPGPDGVPADLWKKLGDTGIVWLTNIFNDIIESGKIPDSWRHSFLVPVYKNKGDVQSCSNYRGITLTSHTLKIWEQVLKLKLSVLTTITPNQFGFTRGRGTTDAIQTLRILTEKYRALKKNLFMAFLDLEKAFDRVPRRLVWQALRSQNLPEAYISLLQDMYNGVSTSVRSPAGTSHPIPVKVGVQQGSALSPLIFTIVLDYLTRDIQDEIPWCLLYADDIALVAESLEELQLTLNKWQHALESNGLRISRTKSEYMKFIFGQPCFSTLVIDQTPVPLVNKFKYLGSILDETANCDADVTQRINSGWMKWRSLSGVLCDRRMPIKTKGKVYKTCVRPVMLYGAECWTSKREHESTLHATEMKMLRWAGGVTKLDRIRNEHVRGSFKVRAIPDKLQESQLRWYGHVMRREQDHPVKIALNIDIGKQPRGRPKATWWRNLEKTSNLISADIQDRAGWRKHIRRADPK